MSAPLFAARYGSRWIGPERLERYPVGMPRAALLDRILELDLDAALVLSLEDAQKIAALPPKEPAPVRLTNMIQFGELSSEKEPQRA